MCHSRPETTSPLPPFGPLQTILGEPPWGKRPRNARCTTRQASRPGTRFTPSALRNTPQVSPFSSRPLSRCYQAPVYALLSRGDRSCHSAATMHGWAHKASAPVTGRAASVTRKKIPTRFFGSCGVRLRFQPSAAGACQSPEIPRLLLLLLAAITVVIVIVIYFHHERTQKERGPPFLYPRLRPQPTSASCLPPSAVPGRSAGVFRALLRVDA